MEGRSHIPRHPHWLLHQFLVLMSFLLLISRANNRKTQACVLRPGFNTSKPGERDRQNPEVGKAKAKSSSLPYLCYMFQNRAHQTLIHDSQSAQKHEQTFWAPRWVVESAIIKHTCQDWCHHGSGEVDASSVQRNPCGCSNLRSKTTSLGLLMKHSSTSFWRLPTIADDPPAGAAARISSLLHSFWNTANPSSTICFLFLSTSFVTPPAHPSTHTHSTFCLKFWKVRQNSKETWIIL